LAGTYDAFFGVNYPSTGVPVLGSGTAVFGSVFLYDNDWDTTTINFTNVTGSFRFETWQCVEFIPVPETSAYDMARTVKEVDQKAIDTANKNAADKPVGSTKPG